MYIDTACMVFSALVACTVYKRCMTGGRQLLFYCNLGDAKARFEVL